MENDLHKLTAKESAFSFIIGFVFFQLFGLVFISLFSVFGTFIKGTESVTNFLNSNAWGYLLLTLFADLGLVFTFIIFNKNKQNQILKKPTVKKSLLYILIACLAFFMLYPIVCCIDTLLTKLGVPLGEISYNLREQNFFASFLAFVVLPPICEELLFRGLILRGLENYGKVFSCFFTGLMFAIFHMSLDQFANPLLFGMLLSCIMYKENNILYTILMHSTCNLLALIFSYFNISLVYNHFSYIVLAFVLLAIFLTCLLLYLFKGNKQSKKQKLAANQGYFVLSMIVMSVLWVCLVTTKIVG